MRRARVALQVAVVTLAAGALLLPLPSQAVERYYADRFYPALQVRLTSWSNASGVSLFDLLLIALAGALIVLWIRCIGEARRRRTLQPVFRGAMATLLSASAIYLWFVAAWGLNYAREPLDARVGYDPARVTPAAVRALAERATAEVNRLHGPAHHAGFPKVGQMPPALVRALHQVEERLGKPVPTTPGRPKRTLLAHFFRASGVDGMHAPFLLETLINPSLTPPEVPAVLAHEWAHLAGYAPEADASFVGLLAALRADEPAQYSAWLSLFDLTVGQLPPGERRVYVAALEPGPRADRRAIAERVESRVDVVARASWETYDRYLKTQGVEEGIESYGRVLQLLLASGALQWR